MALHGEIEDGWQPKGSALFVHGGRIVCEQGNELMSPEELVLWSELYHTIVDCYKIATGQWKHFSCMRWSRDPSQILVIARKYTLEWIESRDFDAHLRIMGFDSDFARAGIHRVLAGEKNDVVSKMLKQIAKQRDSRRSRGGDNHG